MKFISLSIFALISSTEAIQHKTLLRAPPMVTGSQVTADGERWIPTRYSTDSDDQLMKTLIEQGIAYTKDNGQNKSNYQFTTKLFCYFRNSFCSISMSFFC